MLSRLSDPVFIGHRTRSNPELPGSVTSHHLDDRHIEIDVRAQVPASWLSERARAVLDMRPWVRRIERWDLQSGRGSAAYEFTGVPAQATGEMRLDECDDGCLFVTSVTLSVRIPFVGKLVEQSVAHRIARGLHAEALLCDDPPARWTRDAPEPATGHRNPAHPTG